MSKRPTNRQISWDIFLATPQTPFLLIRYVKSVCTMFANEKRVPILNRLKPLILSVTALGFKPKTF